MSQMEHNFTHWDEAVQAAKDALAARRYDDAKHHLHTAQQLGANSTHILKLQTLVVLEEKQQEKIQQHSGFFGFWLGVACYFVLSFVLEPKQGLGLWGAVALVLLPMVLGWRVGRWLGYDSTGNARFWRSFRSIGGACWLYAFFNMIAARMQFSMSSAGGDVAFAWLLVSSIYGGIAGCVAGVVGAKLAWLREGRQA